MHVLSHLIVSSSLQPMGCSPPVSSVHGIFQARILEWVAISSSRRSSWPRDWTSVSSASRIGRQILYHWSTWEEACIGVQPINLVVMVSGEQQRDLAIIIHVSSLPQTSLAFRLPHYIEQSSLYYTVGPCWLSTSNIALCTCPSQTP